jgi:hypothetical protein
MSLSTIPVLFDFEGYNKELAEKENNIQKVEVSKYELKLSQEYKQFIRALNIDDSSLYQRLDNNQYDTLGVFTHDLLKEMLPEENFSLLLNLSISNKIIEYSPQHTSPNWFGGLTIVQVNEIFDKFEKLELVDSPTLDLRIRTIYKWLKEANEQGLGVLYFIM